MPACRALLFQVGGSPGADTDEAGAEESEADLSLSGPGQRRATPQQGEDSSWSRGLDARWAACQAGLLAGPCVVVLARSLGSRRAACERGHPRLHSVFRDKRAVTDLYAAVLL